VCIDTQFSNAIIVAKSSCMRRTGYIMFEKRMKGKKMPVGIPGQG
jgi:hypothetical protein